ncbi:MAG TPA: hypothetical protein VJH20_05435 [Candidatus Nanoarchaeia archaeon]|nr:hypothetical protein [Candidatus Nanoarchaeia archaeon]
MLKAGTLEYRKKKIRYKKGEKRPTTYSFDHLLKNVRPKTREILILRDNVLRSLETGVDEFGVLENNRRSRLERICYLIGAFVEGVPCDDILKTYSRRQLYEYLRYIDYHVRNS